MSVLWKWVQMVRRVCRLPCLSTDQLINCSTAGRLPCVAGVGCLILDILHGLSQYNIQGGGGDEGREPEDALSPSLLLLVSARGGGPCK